MSVSKTYACDLCKKSFAPAKLTGLAWKGGNAIEETPAHMTEYHICNPCLSSLQKFRQRCGSGFECAGGPNCSLAHD